MSLGDKPIGRRIRDYTMRIATLLITALVVSAPATSFGCDLIPLTITKSTATWGKLTVTLGDADTVDHPSAWSGPVTISLEGQPVCTVSESVSIVQEPVLLGKNTLFVSTYSGSQRQIYALDIHTCRVVWKSPVYFADPSYAHGMWMMGSRPLLLDKACRPTDRSH
ncbi:hypothetical protein [Dyella monticola]|nr:hypothetical protein [Dyella monticola]